jgi:hypothetical protein
MSAAFYECLGTDPFYYSAHPGLLTRRFSPPSIILSVRPQHWLDCWFMTTASRSLLKDSLAHSLVFFRSASKQGRFQAPHAHAHAYAHRMTVKSTIFSRLRSIRLPSNRPRPRPRPHPPSIVHPYNLTQARNIILHTSYLLRTKLIHIHYIISRLQSIVLHPCPNNAPSRSSSGCFERHSTPIAVVDRHPRPEPSPFNVFSTE